MKNTFICAYDEKNNLSGYIKYDEENNKFLIAIEPYMFEAEEALNLSKLLHANGFKFEAIWNGAGENNLNLRPFWVFNKVNNTEKEIIADNTSTTANEIVIDEEIFNSLLAKDQENILRGMRRNHVLDWMQDNTFFKNNTYAPIENNMYTPPIYTLEYLEKANIWAPIPEFPEYEINSSTGDVRKISTKELVSKTLTASGKIYYELYNKDLYGKKQKFKARAYLLAITFIPNPLVMEYNQVQYIKDKNVDTLTNLVWSNQSEATKKNFEKGMTPQRKLTEEELQEITDMILSGTPFSYGKLSKKYGLHSFIFSNFFKKMLAEKEKELQEN